jgi:tetratricopeptide (TPR) repeat protein
MRNDLFGRAQYFLTLSRYREVLATVADILAEDPNSAIAYCLKGAALWELGDFQASEEAIRQALELDPNNAFAHYLMSFIWERNLLRFMAVRSAREAIRLEITPTYLHRLAALLFGYRNSQRVDECLKIVKQSLEIDPTHEPSLLLKAEAVNFLGPRPEAIEDLNLALAFNPVSPDVHRSLGIANLAAGNAPEAIRHLQEARRLSPIKHNEPDVLAEAYGSLRGPIAWRDSLLKWCGSCQPRTRVVFLGTLATFFIVVLISTKSSANDLSLTSLLIFVIAVNLLVFLLTIQHYGTIVVRVFARRDLNQSWLLVIVANLGLLLLLLLIHVGFTFIAAVMSFSFALTFSIFAFLANFGLFDAICSCCGRWAWVFVPLTIVGIIYVIVYASREFPNSPVREIASWMVVLLLANGGPYLLNYFLPCNVGS